jgi:hypothetical protein
MKDTHDNSDPVQRSARTARAKGAALAKGLAALTKHVGSPAPTPTQPTATPPTGAAPAHVSPAAGGVSPAAGGEAFGAAMAAELDDADGPLFGEGEDAAN